MTGPEWFGAGCGVFLAAVAYDLAYARYVLATAGRRALAAGGWSAATYVIGLVGLACVLRGSLWLAIPEAAGLAVGTSIGVSRG